MAQLTLAPPPSEQYAKLSNEEFMEGFLAAYKDTNYGAKRLNELFVPEFWWNIKKLSTTQLAYLLLQLCIHHNVDIEGLKQLGLSKPLDEYAAARRFHANFMVNEDDGTLVGIQVDSSRLVYNTPSFGLAFGFGHDPVINKNLHNASRVKEVSSFRPTITATVPPPNDDVTMNVDDEEVAAPPNTPQAKTTNLGSKTAPIPKQRASNNLAAAVGSALRGRRGTTSMNSKRKNHGTSPYSPSLTPTNLQLVLQGGVNEENETSPFDNFVRSMSEQVETISENGSQGNYSEENIKKMDSNFLMSMIVSRLTPMQKAFLDNPRALERQAKLADRMRIDYKEDVVTDELSKGLEEAKEIVDGQESLRNSVIETGKVTLQYLLSRKGAVDDHLLLCLEERAGKRDVEKKAIDEYYDLQIRTLNNERDAKKLEEDNSYNTFESRAKTAAETTKQNISQQIERVEDSVSREEKSIVDDVQKGKAALKAIEVGHAMMGYFCDGETAKAKAILIHLKDCIQPIIAGDKVENMKKHVFDFNADHADF